MEGPPQREMSLVVTGHRNLSIQGGNGQGSPQRYPSATRDSVCTFLNSVTNLTRIMGHVIPPHDGICCALRNLMAWKWTMTAEPKMVHLEHATRLHYTKAVSKEPNHTGNFGTVPSNGNACVVESNDQVPSKMEEGSYREELHRRWAFICQKRATEDKLMEEAHSKFLAAVRERKAAQGAHSEDSEDDGEVILKRTAIEE